MDRFDPPYDPDKIPEKLIWGEKAKIELDISATEFESRLMDLRTKKIRVIGVKNQELRPDTLEFALRKHYGRQIIWLVGQVRPIDQKLLSVEISTGISRNELRFFDGFMIIFGLIIILSSIESPAGSIFGIILGFGLIRCVLWISAQMGSDYLISQIRELSFESGVKS